jgi:hypothetical protein
MKLSVLSLAALLPAAAAAATPFQSQPVFGVSSPRSSTSCINSVVSLRGGAVHESSTLADLESRIQSAALNDKLIVIDFTAT